jgi:hypothetical protein
MKDAKTREEWLGRLTKALRPDFLEAGAEIPEAVRSTCGWPSQGAKAKKKRRIGECWGPKSSKDKHAEVFISPVLSNPTEVGETLVHELVHAAVGIEHGHKAPFRRVAVALGLEGKMTATYAGDALRDRLVTLTSKIGPYPHAKLTFSNKKADTNRQLKLQCPDPSCGYIARTSQKWIDVGCPTCVCGTKMEAV